MSDIKLTHFLFSFSSVCLFRYINKFSEIKGMIPSPPPRTNQQQQQQRYHHPQSHNLTEMARLHRIGRAYSHEGVIESSLGDIDIYYPDEDGE